MLNITVKFDEARAKLGILAKNLRKGLILAIETGLFLLSRKTFETQKSPEGAPWAPLSPRYAELKTRLFPGRGILYARGRLFRSLFHTHDDRRAIVGDVSPSAAAHQFGFTFPAMVIRAKKGNTLRWYGPGGKPIFAKSVKIPPRHLPARPFIPSPETAEREAVRITNETIDDAIRAEGLDRK